MLLVWLNCSTINILSAVVNSTMTIPIMTWSILLYFGVGYAWLNSTRHASLNCIALRILRFYECSKLCKSRSRVPTLKLTSVTQFTRYSIKICYSHYQYPLACTHVRHKAGTLLAMKWLRGKLSDTILLTLPVYYKFSWLYDLLNQVRAKCNTFNCNVKQFQLFCQGHIAVKNRGVLLFGAVLLNRINRIN